MSDLRALAEVSSSASDVDEEVAGLALYQEIRAEAVRVVHAAIGRGDL